METTDENTLFAKHDIENELEKKLTLCKVSLENDSAENNEEKFGSSGEFSADVIGDDTVDNDVAVDSSENGVQQGKREISFVIGEYHKKDLIGDQPLIKNNTIEELKLKLEGKELLFRPRPNTPTSPAVSPTTPTKSLPGEDPEDMIPETRTPPLLSDDGLIAPRKPVNPVREDPGRQNLHRELLFNQKIGKNVLNQKSELQRALEKHKDNLAKKQLENHVAETTPELEKVIADRARRLENPVKLENEEDKVINKEFLQARMKLKSTNEFK